MSTRTFNPDELGPYWLEDTISEAHTISSEVIYEGSDDEQYTSAEARRRACLAAGYRYLQGRAPVMLSTTLRGPFDAQTGWKNPWARQARESSQNTHGRKPALQTVSGPTHSRRSTTIIPKHAKLEASQESHLPSPESLKQASVASTPHRFLEEGELVNLHRWRDEIYTEEQENRRITTIGELPSRKRKPKDSERIRKITGKRQKTSEDYSGQFSSPLSRGGGFSFSQPPRRGCRVAFDDPLKLSFVSAPGKIETQSPAFSLEEQKHMQGSLQTPSQRSFQSRGQHASLAPPPKRSLSIRPCMEEESDDELSLEHGTGIPSPPSPLSEICVSEKDPSASLISSHDRQHLSKTTNGMVALPPDQRNSNPIDDIQAKDASIRCEVLSRMEDAETEMQSHDNSSFDVTENVKMSIEEVSEMGHNTSFFTSGGFNVDTRIEPAGEEKALPGEALVTRQLLSAHSSPQPEMTPSPSTDNQATVDAMVLDQLTQSACNHTSKDDEPEPTAPPSGEPMSGVHDEQPHHDEAISWPDIDIHGPTTTRSITMKGMEGIEPPNAVHEEAERGDMANTAEVVDDAEADCISEISAYERTSDGTNGEDLASGTAGDVPHFSFSALVSKLVPLNPWSSFGSLRRISRAAESTQEEDPNEDAPSLRTSHCDEALPEHISTPTVAQVTSLSNDATSFTPTQVQDVSGPLENSQLPDDPASSAPDCHTHQNSSQEMQVLIECQPTVEAQSTSNLDVLMTVAKEAMGAQAAEEIDAPLEESLNVTSDSDEQRGHSGGLPSGLIVASRCKTPEPRFSIKSMASFMSPSPQHKPRWRPNITTKSAQNSSTIRSALRSPWTATRGAKRVAWAPLPAEQVTSVLGISRQVSPPPESSMDLSRGEDSKFQQHFTAVNRRGRISAGKRRLRSNHLQKLDTAPEQVAMTDVDFLGDRATRTEGGADVAAVATAEVVNDVDMDREASEEPMDIVEDVFNEMSQLLQTWDVDAELEVARVQRATTTTGPQNLF